jgi:multicomponent Na+:H+ antiporter subunit G
MQLGSLILSGLGGVLITAGLVVVIGGAIGLLRFPDVYTRVHAFNASDGVGAALIALGLAMCSPDTGVAVRLVLLALLLGVLAPTLSHLVASAAHAAGLAPVSGRYAAPRPGAHRERDA